MRVFAIICFLLFSCSSPDEKISNPCISKKNDYTRTLESDEKVEYLKELTRIKVLDQQYRKGRLNDSTFVFLQPQIDLENRHKIDSLHCVYGFPTFDKVGIRGCDVAWLVLHHSSDCQWNYKWLKKYLDYYLVQEDGDLNSLLRTINRHYKLDRGKCPYSDIETIIEDYPNFSKLICKVI